MMTVKEIAEVVADLSPEHLAEFRAWFKSFEATRRERHIEDDVRSGRLCQILEKAMGDYRKGKEKPL
jgi:hypothetical protein